MPTPDEQASEAATIAYLMARHDGATQDDADRAAVEAFNEMMTKAIAEVQGPPWKPKPEDPRNHLSGAAIERRMRGGF